MFPLSTHNKRKLWASTVLTSVIISCAAQAGAQSAPQTRVNYATPLSQIILNGKINQNNKAEHRTLDWRKPSLTFTFDLPAANLTDNIELLISGDPRAGVNPRAPLTVQFNNDEPVLLKAKGQGFDARVTLNPLKARTSRNIIRISYDAETGQDCILPQDGGWDINLTSSKLAINSRSKQRALQFREIDNHLSTSGLAPRRVNLIAAGQNATQLQALAAQGIGLRMDTLPNFTTNQRNSDFEIIMARRDELYKYTRDETAIEGTGAAIIIARGRPITLIFTGDTDEQILTSVKGFAQRHLPTARRSVTGLGEMRLQPPLKSDLVRLSGTLPLIDIPTASSFTNWSGDDWASGPKTLRFDVTDPSAMSGEILLRLASSKNISNTSKLNVRLNGESLGTTAIDKRRKSVGFEIKDGLLRGKDNILTLMPELTPNEVLSCDARTGPNFHLGAGSKIILNTDTPSEITELSRMTATAVPFSDDKGQESYIAMTGNQADFHASLKVLSRLAKTSGEGLIAANYSRNIDLAQTENKHVLWLGPSNQLPATLLQNAPRGLTDALRGRGFEGDNLFSANIEQFASLDADASFKLAAQSLSTSRRIRQGGIAALYPSQISGGHIIGVITNTPGQSYVSSAQTLTQAAYWNEIKGGVSRWNNNSVLSVQSAQNVANYDAPKENITSLKPNFHLNTSIFDNSFNAAAQFTETLTGKFWDGIKGFGASIAHKTKSISPKNSRTSDATAQQDSIVPTPRIKPDAAKPSTVVENPQLRGKLQNALHRANGWAGNASTYLRNTTTDPNQSFTQKLLSPKVLLMIIALLLVLLGMSYFTRPISEIRRKN
ncbi:MAG: cellulose biosynthesis cyclic di-GMP-binding regulatory protein BcsB [Litorimonas sp.]